MFRDSIIRTNTQILSRNESDQLKCEVLQNDINLKDLRFCHVTKVTSSDVELTLSRNESDQLKCGD